MLYLIMEVLLVLAAADTACAESGSDYRDGRVVLQVVRNRAKSSWARYDGTLWNALFSRHQHAHGCRAPLTKKHLAIGREFVSGNLAVPAWAKKALWYCNLEAPGTCEDRCLGKGEECIKLGKFAHRFYGLPGKNYGRNTGRLASSRP